MVHKTSVTLVRHLRSSSRKVVTRLRVSVFKAPVMRLRISVFGATCPLIKYGNLKKTHAVKRKQIQNLGKQIQNSPVEDSFSVFAALLDATTPVDFQPETSYGKQT